MYSSAEVAGQTQGELAKVSRSEQVSFDRKGKGPLLFLLGTRRKVNTYKLPHGRPGMFMSPPCVESQSCHLSPLYHLLFCVLPTPVAFSVLSLFCLLAHSSDFFSGKFFNIFFIEIECFWYGSC